jgi:hypothetical protein
MSNTMTCTTRADFYAQLLILHLQRTASAPLTPTVQHSPLSELSDGLLTQYCVANAKRNPSDWN